MELSMMSSFSGSKGPFSVFTILPFQLNRSETFFTRVITSTLSRIIKAPSGRSIRSISSSISNTLHLHMPVRKIIQNLPSMASFFNCYCTKKCLSGTAIKLSVAARFRMSFFPSYYALTNK